MVKRCSCLHSTSPLSMTCSGPPQWGQGKASTTVSSLMGSLLDRVAGVGLADELLGDVLELDVAGAGHADQEGEGLLLVDLVALHQNADGLADRLPGRKGAAQLLVGASPSQGQSHVYGEQGGDVGSLGVDALCCGAVQVESPSDVDAVAQRHCHLRGDPGPDRSGDVD